jgi:hypothetical protein
MGVGGVGVLEPATAPRLFTAPHAGTASTVSPRPLEPRRFLPQYCPCFNCHSLHMDALLDDIKPHSIAHCRLPRSESLHHERSRCRRSFAPSSRLAADRLLHAATLNFLPRCDEHWYKTQPSAKSKVARVSYVLRCCWSGVACFCPCSPLIGLWPLLQPTNQRSPRPLSLTLSAVCHFSALYRHLQGASPRLHAVPRNCARYIVVVQPFVRGTLRKARHAHASPTRATRVVSQTWLYPTLHVLCYNLYDYDNDVVDSVGVYSTIISRYNHT